jgi:hypothetical protein
MKNNETYLQSSRLVLIEKINPLLCIMLNGIANTQMFSTEVVFLPDNKVLVYQESEKAARLIFGRKTSIVLVRVFIIDKIIDKKESLLVGNHYEEDGFNVNYEFNKASTINHGHGAQFFSENGQCSISSLVAIPKKGKNQFIKYCMDYDSLTIGEVSMELVPVFKIMFPFNINNVKDGTFLREFESKDNLYNLRKKSSIPLFKYYAQMYQEGLWVAFNHGKTTNKEINGLSTLIVK